MKGFTQTRLEQIAVEFVQACKNELVNKNPDEPLMVLSVPDTVTNKVVTADFIKDLNEDRLKEYEWLHFFDTMTSMVIDSLASVDPSSKTEEGRYSPSDKEAEWASKVAVAIKRKNLEKARQILDEGSFDSVFEIETAFQAEQPSLPEEGEEEREESIHASFSIDTEQHRGILITVYPFHRLSAIASRGYVRLIRAAICWFFLRNSSSRSSSVMDTIPVVDDIATELRSLTMSGIGFCDDEDIY
jgi:hypothetical protein